MPAEDAAALAALVLRSGPSVGSVRLVCVDGPAGSGKTTLAAALVGALQPLVGAVPVVHGDEVYEGWPVVAGSDDRVVAFVSSPTGWPAGSSSRGSATSQGRTPYGTGTPGPGGRPEPFLRPASVVILEGVGLAATALRERANAGRLGRDVDRSTGCHACWSATATTSAR